jgi:transposase
MYPRYGRAYGGERAHLSAPYHRGNKISIISAISIKKIEAAMYHEGSTNTEIFSHFLEQMLCPILKPRHIVVMDNVGFHKAESVQKLIESTGAKIIYLPPHTPELNPIEEMWSKIKTILRRLSARTFEKFKNAINKAFCSVVPQDLFGYFQHAGY